MARGGRADLRKTHTGFEPQSENEEETEGGALKAASGTEGEESREPSLRDLTGIMQAFMG